MRDRPPHSTCERFAGFSGHRTPNQSAVAYSPMFSIFQVDVTKSLEVRDGAEGLTKSALEAKLLF